MGSHFFLASFKDWLQPLIYLGGGLFIGLVLELLVLSRLASFAEKSKWKSDDVFIKSLRGVIFWIFTFSGIYGALITMPVNISDEHFELIRKAYVVLILFFAVLISSRFIGNVVIAYSSGIEGLKGSFTLMVNVAKLIVYIIGGLIIIQYLGISITPILTALGVGGLAVALALQDTLSNLFSGIQILASRQIALGEYVRLSTGEEGIVDDISWRNTSIRTIQNNVIIIPNSKLATTIITNFSRPESDMTFPVSVGVSYKSDLEKVERVTIEVAKEILRENYPEEEFEPIIRYASFSDFSITLNIIVRVKSFVDQFKIRHELLKRLKKRYDEEGIEIPFPIRTIYLKDSIIK